MLIDMGCCDIVQPDVNWCGGLTELLKISAYADAHGTLVIPHGSSVYSYHFMMTRVDAPFAEFLVMSPDGTEIVPMFTPLLVDEPAPEHGRIKLSDRAGFGVDLNRDLALERPFTH
jgi:L-rhamnonate dehydratase